MLEDARIKKEGDYEASINNIGGKLLKLRVWQRVITMSYFDKYVSVHYSAFDESISGWSDLSPKQKLIMSLKILTDSFGVLLVLAIISEVI